MTTPPNREALRALADAASPGPWRPSASRTGIVAADDEWVCPISRITPDSDVEFIAAARTAIPALLDELERVEAERTRLDGVCTTLSHLAMADHQARMKRLDDLIAMEAQRDAALAEVERLNTEMDMFRAAVQTFSDPISKAVLAQAERDTAERIAAMVVEQFDELLGTATAAEVAAAIRHYRPTSHAPREGGGDE